MIAITAHADGCLLPVKAQPGARKNGIVGEHAGALKVAVTAPPDRGRANKALTTLLAELLEVRKAQIALVNGDTSHVKRFLVTGLTVAELQARLTRLLETPP